MQEEDDDGAHGTNQEAIRNRLVNILLEEAAGTNKHVLDARSERRGQRLTSPLVSGIFFGARQIISLGVEDPSNDCVVDGDTDG